MFYFLYYSYCHNFDLISDIRKKTLTYASTESKQFLLSHIIHVCKQPVTTNKLQRHLQCEL